MITADRDFIRLGLAAIGVVHLLCAPAMAQDNQTRRASPPTPASLPAVRGARQSENMKRAMANRAATDRERLALVEAMVNESGGDPVALEKATAELAPLLERQKSDPAALMLAGRIATIAQQPAIAAFHYRAVLAISPNNSEAALGLGNALTTLNDVAGADAAFARYREIIGLAPR
jgi:Flp pilus assembly protein TadD